MCVCARARSPDQDSLFSFLYVKKFHKERNVEKYIEFNVKVNTKAGEYVEVFFNQANDFYFLTKFGKVVCEDLKK